MSYLVGTPELPPRDILDQYIDEIYRRGRLTNHGPLVQELEKQLAQFLHTSSVQCVANGTAALQLALEALDIHGEVITTPFTYVATLSSLLWQRCTPVFADIEPTHFTLDPSRLEAALTPRTQAVLPVHVFGFACEVEQIEQFARAHRLKVIYDAAHTFGSFYKGRALADYGDAAALSFHATKLFHTAEGGACVMHDNATAQQVAALRSFGNETSAGINAKMSEFHAALGLAGLPQVASRIQARRRLWERYTQQLKNVVQTVPLQADLQYNYAYYPVLFKDEQTLLRVAAALGKKQIFLRRYFYPSLNMLPYVTRRASCPVSEDISRRIACLPLHAGLTEADVDFICREVQACL